MNPGKQPARDSHAAETLPGDVAVTVEGASATPRYMKFRGIGAYMNTSVDEAVARVRAWRDGEG